MLPQVRNDGDRVTIARRLYGVGEYGTVADLLSGYVTTGTGNADIDEAVYLLGLAYLGQNFVDRFSRSQVALVEDAHFPDLKDQIPTRNLDKVAEPVIVVGIVGGLVALFFQNRP